MLYDNGMPAPPTLDPAFFSQDPAALASFLHERGVCRIADWPDASLAATLREDVSRLQREGALAPAAVGRGEGRGLHASIRGDSTLWLDDPRCGAPARAFLARMDTVRIALNRALFLGLDEFEAHYAVYPPGHGYARHRDRFRDSDARVVTWVSYLNDDWGADDGGELRLYPFDDVAEHGPTDDDDGMDRDAAAGAGKPLDVAPLRGSLCFLSEIEHEVLPARRPRLSIAGWFRRRSGHLP